MRCHEELLAGARAHDSFGWKDRDSLKFWRLGRSSREACGDPALQGVVVLPGGSDSLAAAMGSEGCRLPKKEAVCWRGGEDPASASFTNQGIKIEVVVETQEGELEAILSPLLSMAGAAIAAQLRQDRLDVLFEGDREPGLSLEDLYRETDLVLVVANDHLGPAASNGCNDALPIYAQQAFIGRLKFRLPRQVNLHSITGSGQEHLLGAEPSAKTDGCRGHLQLAFLKRVKFGRAEE
tara:strand:+ start:981 stop:1691 length:711 start_codon:yes stop_codon:yes gene_type:complete